jgi:hypothetical protein
MMEVPEHWETSLSEYFENLLQEPRSSRPDTLFTQNITSEAW